MSKWTRKLSSASLQIHHARPENPGSNRGHLASKPGALQDCSSINENAIFFEAQMSLDQPGILNHWEIQGSENQDNEN